MYCRAGPRRSEDGGALTAEGMYRAAYAMRGGEYERGFPSYERGFPSYKGIRGPPRGNF